VVYIRYSTGSMCDVRSIEKNMRKRVFFSSYSSTIGLHARFLHAVSKIPLIKREKTLNKYTKAHDRSIIYIYICMYVLLLSTWLLAQWYLSRVKCIIADGVIESQR